MADFWQPGAITVLQRLKTRPIVELEGEIEAIARRRPIVLLLPALYSEFESASMPHDPGGAEKGPVPSQDRSVARPGRREEVSPC